MGCLPMGGPPPHLPGTDPGTYPLKMEIFRPRRPMCQSTAHPDVTESLGSGSHVDSSGLPRFASWKAKPLPATALPLL